MEIYTKSARSALMPTATVTTLPATATVTTTAPAVATPKPTSLPSELDAFVCPNDTRIIPLSLPADAIRMSMVGDQLFLLANGDLYQLVLDNGDPALVKDEPLTLTNVMPSARQVGPYTIQELVYLTVDEQRGDLLLLDKSNDVYRYAATGQWTVAVPAAPVPNQFPDPQYLAIQGDGTRIYALDADLSRIWLLRNDIAAPQVALSAAGLLTGVDMVLLSAVGERPRFGVFRRDGSIARFGAQPEQTLASTAVHGRRPWPTQLLLANDLLYAVDGETRQVTVIDPQRQQVVRKIAFRLPELQRLRSVIVQGDQIYALAGPNLYIAELHNDASCPPVPFDNNYYFAGRNLQELLADFRLPFANTVLPDRPRSYPGARRLYRYGVHQGVDIYGFDAPGLYFGSPVFNVATGTVLRADHDYVELSPIAYEAAVAQTEREHRTPPALEKYFLGRQVIIDHSDGLESRYMHLQTIAPEIAVGTPITQGVTVGTVGVSGTSSGAYGTADGSHLHFELWINGRYLGQGLSLYETMRLWQAVFGQ